VSAHLGRSGSGEVMESKESKHLKLMSVFHYVFAGYFIVIGVLAFRFMMTLIFGSAELLRDPNRTPNPSESLDSWGAVFGISSLYILWWILAIALLLTGINLWKKKSRKFCLIVAGVECLSFPLGTILGVFTLTTLTKESVKKLFANHR
jgi:hypothetical protein